MIFQQKNRINFNSKRTFQFSDDGVIWSEPKLLRYYEKHSLWPWADSECKPWKFIKI